jgi:hypothetical protein
VNANGPTFETSNINFEKGQSITNLVIAPMTPDGKVNFHLKGQKLTGAHLIVDIVGYFTSGTA